VPDAPGVRHVSIDRDNNVWIGGYPYDIRSFHKLSGSTGQILDSFAAPGCGGYGGLVDKNGILWSASLSESSLLRYDPNTRVGTCILSPGSYGLGIDSQGIIWNSQFYDSAILSVDPNGNVLNTYPTGGFNSRGVAVTSDDDVWAANSGSDTVTRLNNADGNIKARIPVGITPTGVSVDSDGYVPKLVFIVALACVHYV